MWQSEATHLERVIRPMDFVFNTIEVASLLGSAPYIGESTEDRPLENLLLRHMRISGWL